MTRFRFSLLGLAGLVTLVAMACAALAYASSWLAATIWWGAYLLLLFGALAALLRSPPQRAWWIGFAMFGWVFILATHGPLSNINKQLRSNAGLQKVALKMPRAMTTITAIDHYGIGGYGGGSDTFRFSVGIEGQTAMGEGMAEISGAALDGMSGMPGGAGGSMGAATFAPVMVQTVDNDYVAAFVSTSQALLTLLSACLGGLAGRLIWQRNAAEHSRSPGAPTGG